MQSLALFIYTESSWYAGTGSTVSVVDLPIQRERTTNYPIVQGSGIKGALRSQATVDDKVKNTVFGPDSEALKSDKNGAHAGAISVGDARIVLFPVCSLMGVFAYVTCPHVLARLGRDVQGLPALSVSLSDDQALVPTANNVSASGSVVLEEFSFTATPHGDASQIAAWLARYALPQGDEYAYWRKKVMQSLVILPDNAFKDFVTTSTEVVTRVRIDSTKKTVIDGALWTQESLPPDTLLMSKVFISARKDTLSTQDVVGCFNNRLQIGGNETTGDGFVVLNWLN